MLLSPRLVSWQNRVGALEVGTSPKSELELGDWLQPLIYCIYFIAKAILIKAFIIVVHLVF